MTPAEFRDHRRRFIFGWHANNTADAAASS